VIGAVIGAAVGGVAVVMLELEPPSVAAAVAVVFGVALLLAAAPLRLVGGMTGALGFRSKRRH